MNLSVIWSEKVNKAFLDCCLPFYSERQDNLKAWVYKAAYQQAK